MIGIYVKEYIIDRILTHTKYQLNYKVVKQLDQSNSMNNNHTYSIKFNVILSQTHIKKHCFKTKRNREILI